MAVAFGALANAGGLEPTHTATGPFSTTSSGWYSLPVQRKQLVHRAQTAAPSLLEIEDTRRIHGYTQLVYATGGYTTNRCTRPHLCTRQYIEK